VRDLSALLLDASGQGAGLRSDDQVLIGFDRAQVLITDSPLATMAQPSQREDVGGALS
jgi:hypothetical protein